MSTILSWNDYRREGRYLDFSGRFQIDRLRPGVFTLTEQFAPGAYRVACQGSLRVCKAFASDIAAGRLVALPSGNYAAPSVPPLAKGGAS